jgi:hypothetical protein
MKKVLSLLTAFGLVATTGSAVVSCTKKVEIVFDNLTSITANNWKANNFGLFFGNDFDLKTNPDRLDWVEIINKEKLSNYTAAAFTNYQEAYNQLNNNANLSPTIYQFNQKTGEYFAITKKETVFNKNQNYLQITGSTKDGKTGYLPIKVATNIGDQETTFDLTSWLNSGGQQETITIDENWATDNPTLSQLSKKIAKDYQEIKKEGNLLATDQAIHDMFNFLGEYLIMVKNYVVDYTPQEKVSLAVSIKQQFNRFYDRLPVGQKNKIRQNLVNEWQSITDINHQTLNWTMDYADGQSATVAFDFTVNK